MWLQSSWSGRSSRSSPSKCENRHLTGDGLKGSIYEDLSAGEVNELIGRLMVKLASQNVHKRCNFVLPVMLGYSSPSSSYHITLAPFLGPRTRAVLAKNSASCFFCTGAAQALLAQGHRATPAENSASCFFSTGVAHADILSRQNKKGYGSQCAREAEQTDRENS